MAEIYKDLKELKGLLDDGIITKEEFQSKKQEILANSSANRQSPKKRNIFDWYGEVWKKYAVFKGRACRAEYWSLVLVNILIGLALILIETLMKGYFDDSLILLSIYQLIMMVPSLATIVRRLHDTDRNGWNYLLVFVPVVGFIILLVFLIEKGTDAENSYGPNPVEE